MGQFKPATHEDKLASGERPFARPITGKDNPIRPIDMNDANFMPKKNTPAAVAKYVCQVGECSGLNLGEKRKSVYGGTHELHDPDKFKNSHNGKTIEPK
jgi:hypothetical protein